MRTAGRPVSGGGNQQPPAGRAHQRRRPRVRITEDTRSELSVPLNAMAGYLVGVHGNNIHVRGIAQKLGDDRYTSFHFVETPTP